MSAITSPPARGDLVEVQWVDINEEPVGDPDAAKLARRTSYGLFWCQKEDAGVPVLVTTTTMDDGPAHQSGYCIYPVSCVVKLKIVKRGRKR